MSGKKTQWQQAQAEELECWSYNQVRVSDPRYMEKKREYWQRMLARVGLSLDTLTGHDQKILEVGCGPTGIFILLEEPAPSYGILDPLLDEYQKLYTHPFYPVQKIALPLEDVSTETTHGYTVVFAINCVDHVRDIRVFLEQLRMVTIQSGTVYLAVNTHVHPCTARIWRSLQWLLEPHHPYHFTKAEYQQVFAPYFEIESIVDIEEDIIWINQETQSIGGQKKSRFWRRFLGWLHPVRIFFGVLAWFGLPAHDFSGRGRSIYRHQMFIMRPRPHV